MHPWVEAAIEYACRTPCQMLPTGWMGWTLSCLKSAATARSGVIVATPRQNGESESAPQGTPCPSSRKYLVTSLRTTRQASARYCHASALAALSSVPVRLDSALLSCLRRARLRCLGCQIHFGAFRSTQSRYLEPATSLSSRKSRRRRRQRLCGSPHYQMRPSKMMGHIIRREPRRRRAHLANCERG